MEQSNVKLGDCGRCNRPVMSTDRIGSVTYRAKNPSGQLGPARSYLAHQDCADQEPVMQEYPVVVTEPAELLDGLIDPASLPELPSEPAVPVPSMPVREQKGTRKPPAKKAPAAPQPPERVTSGGDEN